MLNVLIVFLFVITIKYYI